MKPRIFIGSSKESVKIAEKVKSLLDGEYVCQLWCDNFFDLGQCTYHELLKKSLSFDYAIFIGGKDDYVRRESDRTHKYAARDNVYLEFGLYAGILTYEGTLEDRANRIEQRRQKYSEYEQKCLEEIEQLTKQRDEALEKQEVKK